jgi:hypothetical protein
MKVSSPRLSVQLRTGDGTHNHESTLRRSLRPRLGVLTGIGGYGSRIGARHSLACPGRRAITHGFDFQTAEGVTPHPRGATHPSCARKTSLKIRGRGECRVPNAPAASCALCSWSMHTSIHSGGTGNIRHSPRDGFTAYCALSPGTGLFCPRRSRDKPATLTPASGRQDHTPLPSASSAFVSHAISVHHIPLSTSVTIAIRPSCGGGIAGRIHNFCFSESEIFVRGQLQPRSA